MPHRRLNLIGATETYGQSAFFQEVGMTHWHDSMVDQPETSGPAYAAGWTLSGLAVLGVILSIWVLGI